MEENTNSSVEGTQQAAFLPLGTVVTLKGSHKRLMIIGRGQQEVRTGRLYAYAAVAWPEGLISARTTCMFNPEAIGHLIFIGLQDEQEMQFREQIDEQWAEITRKESAGSDQSIS